MRDVSVSGYDDQLPREPVTWSAGVNLRLGYGEPMGVVGWRGRGLGLIFAFALSAASAAVLPAGGASARADLDRTPAAVHSTPLLTAGGHALTQVVVATGQSHRSLYGLTSSIVAVAAVMALPAAAAGAVVAWSAARIDRWPIRFRAPPIFAS